MVAYISMDAWLDAVHEAGGNLERPPSPQIPVDYQARPRRQPRFRLDQYIHPSSNTGKPRAPLVELDSQAANRVAQRPQEPCSMAPRKGQKKTSKTPAKAKRTETTDDDAKAGIQDVSMTLPTGSRLPVRSRIPTSVSLPMLQKGSNPVLQPPELTPSGAGLAEHTASATQELASTKSKTRATSPTKRMVDLCVENKIVERKTARSPQDVPEDVQQLLRDVWKKVNIHNKLIPGEFKDQVLAGYNFDSGDVDGLFIPPSSDVDQAKLEHEFFQLQEVRNETERCTELGCHESSWNERVHRCMLALAVRHREGFDFENITSARIVKGLVPTNMFGEALKNRIIDYAIILKEPLIPRKQVMARLSASSSTTINASDYSPLCYRPVAIGIETKQPSGSKESAEVQLAVWMIAYFNRLRALGSDPVSITIPLILVSANRWELMFARDKEGQIEIVSAMQLGDTSSLVDCYKILAVLRLICDWVEKVFVPWFKKEILSSE